MKPLSFLKPGRLAFAVVMVAASIASAAAEKPTATLTRTAATAALTASLTKDIYKQVPYESEYEVQVPYEVEVSYTDYEDDDVQEYVCHDRTDDRYECRNVSRCDDVPVAPTCTYETVCRQVGGGRTCQQQCFRSERPGEGVVCREFCGPAPGGGQQCEQVQRCSGGGSRRECRDEQSCGNVPYTRQECGYETVRRSRPVTRTRMETRYRSETRCCETRYRPVLDFQAELNVEILVPAQAVLENAEKESFKLEMTSADDVRLDFANTLYGYRIADRRLAGRNLTLRLELAPKYSAAELGEKTVSGLSMTIKNGAATAAFTDAGLKPKVTTSYQVSVADKKTGEVLELTGVVASSGKDKVSVALKQKYSTDVEYAVGVVVKREGPVLAGVLSFVKSFTRSKDPLKLEQFDGRVVAVPKISGSLRKAKVVFKDGAPATSEVTTTYKVKLAVRGGFLNLGKKVIVEKTVPAAAFTRSSAGIVEVNLAKLGAANEDLDRLSSGAKAWIDVTVTRKGARLNGGKALTIARSSETNVP